MSLAIDVDAVTLVLLADGWHPVHKDSFDLDAYEYLHEGEVIFGGGSHAAVPSTGARWVEKDGKEVACPITSILAVKVDLKKKKAAAERARTRDRSLD